MFCQSIKKLETLPSGTDVLEVVVGLETAYMFYPYHDALKFLNHDVIVEFRDDLYKGNIEKFITTITEKCVVNVLTKDTNMKLYTNTGYNKSNISFIDFHVGDSAQQCIIYCAAAEYKSSPRAIWLDLTCIDKLGKVAHVRLFDYDNTESHPEGKYINTDLRRTEYGFITDVIVPMSGSIPVNPEVSIAKTYILNSFNDDEDFSKIMLNTGILDIIEEKVTEERGYELVHIANELCMIDNLKNQIPGLDIESMKRASVASRWYMTRIDYIISPESLAVMFTMNSKLKKRAALINIVDSSVVEESDERKIYQSIKKTVNVILETRKMVN